MTRKKPSTVQRIDRKNVHLFLPTILYQRALTLTHQYTQTFTAAVVRGLELYIKEKEKNG